MDTLTQTIARAKLPNETMTQTLHRLRKGAESITQTAGRLAREGDIIDVIVEETNPPPIIEAPEELTITEPTPIEELTLPKEEVLSGKTTLTPTTPKAKKVEINATADVTKEVKKPRAKKKTTATKKKATPTKKDK